MINNLSHCFIAINVKKLSNQQHLDRTEDITVCLLTRNQVLDLMVNDQVKQALMAAPLWRYFAEYPKNLQENKVMFSSSIGLFSESTGTLAISEPFGGCLDYIMLMVIVMQGKRRSLLTPCPHFHMEQFLK